MQRIIDLMGSSIRGPFSTRAWIALYFPMLTGVFWRHSIEDRFADLMMGGLVVALYSLALWFEKRFLTD